MISTFVVIRLRQFKTEQFILKMSHNNESLSGNKTEIQSVKYIQSIGGSQIENKIYEAGTDVKNPTKTGI